ncbi:MAG: ABC transporter permease [Desulfovibrio sp.]|jgi:microcin C transport system permease protein|nr:ABC transporter permease [Desulfovibrio sp.]
MNVIAQRRRQAFVSNRRAVVCLCLLGACVLFSLGAELIANDRPMLIRYGDRFLVPPLQSLTERDFGGDLGLPADFGDPFVLDAISGRGWAIWPPVRYGYNTISYSREETFPGPPSPEHPLGTDDQGRDVFARVLYGFRLSFLFGLCLTVCGSVPGVLAGVVQGYYGGGADLWFQRFMEIWGGIPVLYLLIIISSMVRMTFWILLAVMLLFGWMRLVNVVRAESLRIRNMDYVRAARALGVSDCRIMLRHVLPNALVAVVSMLPFQMSASIVALTALDFLGFGLPAGYPSLGELVAQGKNNLHAPWIGLTVFCTLAFLLTSLVMIGEGVRDAFDPRVFTGRPVPAAEDAS